MADPRVDFPADATELVATLLANPDGPGLSAELVDRAEAALRGAGLGSIRRDVLADGVAVDLAGLSGDPRALEGRLRDALAGAPADVAVQPEAGRRKRLLLADMDSTMIEQECVDELADLVGLKAKVAAITDKAMRGELSFEPALRERVALLRGLRADVVDRLLAERITLMPGGRALLATMKRDGAHACLVSGGFTAFTDPIAAWLGFDENRANRLGIADGHLDGTVAEPILGRDAKLAALEELRGRLGLDASEVLAVGDGANDLLMLGAAGLGVAYRAKPAVAAAAHARIDHGDLTALLYLQGYRREAFAA